MLNYRCLVLDHDDTVVRSEETVNYPSFLEALKVLRPGRTITREEFTRWCFSPGFSALCSDYIGLTPEEIDVQYDMWRSYVATHIPPPYDGLRPILTRWKQEGGLLCVSSHSARENILRDYRLHFGLEPDQIFDWDLGEDRRKPSPYALQEIMRLYDLRPDELLMVDDLKPGYDMAHACGVPFACAGWSHDDPEIRAFLRRFSDFYLETVQALESLLFGA
ncbi:HAD family hydrolase [Faecousia sp.]|uniref:HAD family hydrolase n=1 Tax=Faecousia sp. TaxID=2952921 RepID=UPI003A1D0747